MPAIDLFKSRFSLGFQNKINEPSEDQFPITPSDSTELEFVTRQIIVGAACTIKFVNSNGRTIELPEGFLVPGVPYNFRIKKVFATGTTAGVVILGVV